MTHAGDFRLVGRAEPLQRLAEALSLSAGGHRHGILVSGEAGIGKTALVRAAIEATDDLTVGWGTCWAGAGAPGFWPWMQAFGDIARAIGLDTARAAAGPDGDTLSVLIPGLGDRVETTDDPDRHRLLLLDAAVRWLETLSAARHVVVVLDDLQWADTSTFDLLDHIMGAPITARLLVVGLYRHDELDRPEQERLSRVGLHTTDVRLHGLDVESVTAILASTHDPVMALEVAPELHRRTGGHPLFVRELARLPEFGAGGPLPTAVAGAVIRRLETLPEATWRVLEAASVLGNRLLPDVLGAVVELPAAAIVDQLRPALDGGVVRREIEDAFWFAHDLFRETLYERLDPSRRSVLHGKVAAALVDRGHRGGVVAAGDIARHFAQAARTGDPAQAVEWAWRAAADEDSRSAPAEAAGHLRRARRSATDAGWAIPTNELASLLMAEAGYMARSGSPDSARKLLNEASRVDRSPQAQADVALAVQRLGAKFSAPRDEVIDQLESALAAVTGSDLIRQAQLTAALARELQHSIEADRARAAPLSEAALAVGRETGDAPTIVACLLARHDAIWEPGTGEQRAQLGREIAAVSSGMGDTDRHAEGLLLEANGLLESGSPDFRSVLDQWFRLLEKRRDPRDRYMIATRRAALALIDGDAEAALELMDEAKAIGEQIHEPDTGNVYMSQRVALARARNEPDALRALAVDAVAWWTGAPALAHAVAAGAYAGSGDLDAARKEIDLVAASGGWQAEGSYLRSVLVAHLAEAAAAVGDAELCRDLADVINPIAGSCGVNGALVAFAGPFAHAAGVLAAAMGDHDTATKMLATSVATAQGLNAAVWVEQGTQVLDNMLKPAADAEPGVTGIMERADRVWEITFGEERGSVPHVKGLADIAQLVRNRGHEVSALHLVGGVATSTASTDSIVDTKALAAYRDRLDDLSAEIETAEDHADLGQVEKLTQERDFVLAEIRSATGLGGRLRTGANDPAERARKAVSARIRDAIRRLEDVTPSFAAHLDRSIQTGLNCSYDPQGEDRSIVIEAR